MRFNELDQAPLLQHVQTLWRLMFVPKPLVPIVVISETGTSDWDDGQDGDWVVDILNLLEKKTPERQDFVTAAGKLSIPEQVLLVCQIFDSGWEDSGRRSVLPTLIDELIDLDQARVSREGEEFLTQCRRQFELRAAISPVAEEIVKRLPDRVVNCQQDLIDLGLMP